jgi:hypothetical protein
VFSAQIEQGFVSVGVKSFRSSSFVGNFEAVGTDEGIVGIVIVGIVIVGIVIVGIVIGGTGSPK